MAKLNLGSQIFVEDEHVMKIIQRCKRLTELSLKGTSITYNSLICIIENLKHNLVILQLCNTNLSFDELLELKEMPKLKVLICSHLLFRNIDDLKEQYPNCWYTKYELLESRFYEIATKFKKITNVNLRFTAYQGIHPIWVNTL